MITTGIRGGALPTDTPESGLGSVRVEIFLEKKDGHRNKRADKMLFKQTETRGNF
jgi:hypothetical protein